IDGELSSFTSRAVTLEPGLTSVRSVFDGRATPPKIEMYRSIGLTLTSSCPVAGPGQANRDPTIIAMTNKPRLFIELSFKSKNHNGIFRNCFNTTSANAGGFSLEKARALSLTKISFD